MSDTTPPERGVSLTPGVHPDVLKDPLGDCRLLREVSIRVVLDTMDGRVQDDPRHLLVLASWTRGTSTFAGILELAELGYGPQALMLGRSLFEDAEVATWLVALDNDDELRALWEEHFDLQNLRIVGMDPEASHTLDGERAAELAAKFNDPRNQGFQWTRASSHVRRKEIRDALPRLPILETVSLGLDTLAERHVIWAHAMLHNSPWGHAEVLGQLIHPSGDLVAGTGASGTRVPLALELAFYSFAIATHSMLALQNAEAVTEWLTAIAEPYAALRDGLPALIDDENSRRDRLQAERVPIERVIEEG